MQLNKDVLMFFSHVSKTGLGSISTRLPRKYSKTLPKTVSGAVQHFCFEIFPTPLRTLSFPKLIFLLEYILKPLLKLSWSLFNFLAWNYPKVFFLNLSSPQFNIFPSPFGRHFEELSWMQVNLFAWIFAVLRHSENWS